MRSFQSFFHEHNSEWSEAERDARWREAATKSGERRAYRRNLRSTILVPFSGERIEAREEGRTAMEVRLDSLRRRRGSENDAPFWSLGMVVAWVMWRDFGRVTEMERDPFASDTTLCVRASLDAIMGVRFAEASTKKAFMEISVAAQKGQLSFTGIASSADQKPVRAEEWVHFASPDAEYTKMKRKDGREVYRDLYVNREEVLALWPALEAWRAPLPDAGMARAKAAPADVSAAVQAVAVQVAAVADVVAAPAAPKANVSEAQVRRWFVHEFIPASPKQVPKTAVVDAAQIVMPTVPRAVVRKIMDENWPHEWSKKPGPKGPRTDKNNSAE